ncbi:MAG: prenyltransferase/squalene oxidase repeat-containing protein [Candidatus Brocadiia bacterium]
MKKSLVVVLALIIVPIAILFFLWRAGVFSAAPPSPTPATSSSFVAPKDLVASMAAGVEAMKKLQKPDGGWGTQINEESDPAITSIVLKGLAQAGVKPEQEPWMQKGIDNLLSFQHADGSIFGKSYQVYVTAIAVSLFCKLDPQRTKYGPVIEKGKNYLMGVQYRKGDPRMTDPAYEGGISYSDENKPPNLSTTEFALQALYDAGVPKDSEAFKLAAKFVSRCQNRSESNDLPGKVRLLDDGGFFYAPGDSRGEKTDNPDGTMTLRSYGSMTYAGMLSLMYCHLTADDPRIKSAIEWVSKNYNFEVNPGMPLEMQGYFYYLNVMAKTVATGKLTQLPDGKPIMEDLKTIIMKRQLPDGTWVNNKEERWLEGNPTLSTAYMLEALGLLKETGAK